MALSSMTGLRAVRGATDSFAFSGKSSQSIPRATICACACRPAGMPLKPALRKDAADSLARGTVYANLAVKPLNTAPAVRINEDVLAVVERVSAALQKRTGAAPATVDGLPLACAAWLIRSMPK